MEPSYHSINPNTASAGRRSKAAHSTCAEHALFCQLLLLMVVQKRARDLLYAYNLLTVGLCQPSDDPVIMLGRATCCMIMKKSSPPGPTGWPLQRATWPDLPAFLESLEP